MIIGDGCVLYSQPRRTIMPTPRRYIHIGSTTFYQGAARSQPEWELAASQLLDEGQVFLAYDLAKIALVSFPKSVGLKQIMALALIRTGALDEARKVLDLLCPDFSPDDTTLMRISAE